MAGLPGDTDDSHSRYLKAAIERKIIAYLYLPNGNPAPGPKFDYKLRWFPGLSEHAASLVERDIPVILTGDYNMMSANLDLRS